MRKWLRSGISATLVVAALALSGCGGGSGSGSSSGGAITVEGSDTMVNLGQAWAEGYMAKDANVVITVKGGGSGNGIAALINGTVDFADASRAMKPEEITQAKAAGVDPVQHVVAKDGISIIVNPSNPVKDITVEQLGKVYRGEIANWKELGGEDKKIVLLARDTSSGTYEFFKEAVVGKDAEYAQSTLNLGSNQQIVDEVKGNDAAIGYVGLGYAANAGSEVKRLTVAGVVDDVANVLNKSYPLGRDLYMYSNGQPSEVEAAYLKWITGPEGQAIVEQEGFVPLG